MTTKKFKLYIWPHHWELPSLDADCLSCVFYLQIYFAGQYCLVESTDPDVSPSGSLPFLEVHENVESGEKHPRGLEHEHASSPSTSSNSPKTIATARSILNYLETIKRERSQRGNSDHQDHIGEAQRTAWSALVNSKLRDLFVSNPFIHYTVKKWLGAFTNSPITLESRPVCEP